MISEAVKLARLQAKKERDLAEIGLLRDLVKNPVVELVGGYVLVEYLQRHPTARPIIGNLQGNAIEAAFTAIIAVQQLAPSVPYLAQGASDVLGAVGKLAPVLGAL
jgi:hypothetical protein